jgi:hypothetical protein
MSIMLYYVDDFACESMMASLVHIEEGAPSNNLTKVIMKVVSSLTEMPQDDIVQKMVAFAVGKHAF